MKRKDAVTELAQYLETSCYGYEAGETEARGDADLLLVKLENIGFRPPRLPEMNCQALMDVYHGGYNFHQWEEDFYLDKEAVGALNKRIEYSNLTPEERKQKRRDRQSRD